MSGEHAKVGIELVEAYARADIPALLNMISFPFAIFIGSDLLVLNGPKDLANFSDVYRRMVFRGKVLKLDGSLIGSKQTERESIIVDLRLHHDVVGKPRGHSATGRFYFRMIDGRMKSEMLELIEFDPTGPFALAFAALKSGAAKDAELAI